MFPPIRNQADVVNQKQYSDAAGLDCSDLPDLARQEYKREADVNHLLSRYGVAVAIPQRQVSFGEQDFDLDLHGAYIAVEAADQAWFHLPPALKQKYGNRKAMLDAMNSGELAKDLAAQKDLNTRESEPAPVAPTPEATP